MNIPPNCKLLFVGDSITDCGRARPVGEGSPEALGTGYVALIDSLLTTLRPERPVRVVNMGVSGNTVRDLKARWQTDVIQPRPDWLAVMIGVNDVWRQFDRAHMTETHISPQTYERTLHALLRQARPLVRQLVLFTPFLIEPNPDDLMRARLSAYGTIVKKLAARHRAVLVDTQAAFDQILRHQTTHALSRDRVHPNLTGHMVIARAFVQAVDAPL